ncbi:MAG TPA: acetolactate synthase large subunit [Candidatus Binataceae bacterium]|nr:acetolactate synthase large subunit [Candidatus Binataceae bacterium]
MSPGKKTFAANLLVRCLEREGVKYIFGIPGEENIHLVDALKRSSIRFILVRHEQGAAFMADMYGRVTGQAGVCIATLGPGAINLLLGVADAHTDSAPLVAISAQVALSRIYKESHQSVDLTAMFRPVAKWSDTVLRPEAIPEMVRKAFKLAQTERPGAVYLSVPEDIEKLPTPRGVGPLPINIVYDMAPSAGQIKRAAAVLKNAKAPIVLAGHGAARNDAGAALVRFSERLGIPVATTFMGKGVFPDDHPNALGALGFMRHDYANFGFDRADAIVCVGYDLQEYAPERINPDRSKAIVHVHRYPAEVDANYHVAVGIEGNISESLDALVDAVKRKIGRARTGAKIRGLLQRELSAGAKHSAFPLKPQRIVAEIRRAMGRDDVVLVDTGAVKMWMARLYPAYAANTCLISNGLATMAFSLPGALAVKLACPDRKVLAVMGDGSFLMNSQELETAVREKIPFTALIWEDHAYGLIKWKMDLELGRDSHCDFTNPDFVAYAESFGVKGYRVNSAAELLPTLQSALASNRVSLVVCPVDYSENLALTKMLGELTDPL